MGPIFCLSGRHGIKKTWTPMEIKSYRLGYKLIVVGLNCDIYYRGGLFCTGIRTKIKG